MLLRELYNVDEVVSELGGPKVVMELTGRAAKYASQTVWNWKAAGGFPPDTFDLLSGALEQKGCSAPRSLWRFRKSNPAEATHADA